MSDDASSPATQAAARPSMLTLACALALLGLAVSVLHFMWPTPLTFTLFMIAGQGAFGTAMVLYGVAIFRDLRRRRVL